MDKFDVQITLLKPPKGPAKLDEKQFMKKLNKARRTQQTRRLLLALTGVAAVLIITGALRRNIIDLIDLTLRYFTELPSLFSEYSSAYAATISWPSVVSIMLLTALGGLLFSARKDITAIRSHRTYRYAAAISVLAIGLALTGLLSSPNHANAQQDALKRGLNERGHLEVQVNGKSYELNAQSSASEASIRNQAFIEEVRNLDISKIYPDLKDMNISGFVIEVREVKPDGCIMYAERRLDPTLNSVVDADTGCISDFQPLAHLKQELYYLNQNLQPIPAPTWEVGQALYLTSATNTKTGYFAPIVVTLQGKADSYVAASRTEKVIPKGQPSTGIYKCGINRKDTCPHTGVVSVFFNTRADETIGNTRNAIVDRSFEPRREMGKETNFFGKIIAMDDQALQLETLNGQKIRVAWTRNIIEEFNRTSARHHPTNTGPLVIRPGDNLILRILYPRTGDLNLEQLTVKNDVTFIGLATQLDAPDPLKNDPYPKDNNGLIEKY